MVWKHPNPAVKKEYKIGNAQDVIAFHTDSLLSLDQLNKRNQESKKAEKARLEENAKNLESIRASLSKKEYDRITGTIGGFNNQSALMKREEMADFRFMMAFGFGFISIMFLGFLTGYFIGKVILSWDENKSLLLALGTGIPTLFLEAILMMFRLEKWEKAR